MAIEAAVVSSVATGAAEPGPRDVRDSGRLSAFGDVNGSRWIDGKAGGIRQRSQHRGLRSGRRDLIEVGAVGNEKILVLIDGDSRRCVEAAVVGLGLREQVERSTHAAEFHHPMVDRIGDIDVPGAIGCKIQTGAEAGAHGGLPGGIQAG